MPHAERGDPRATECTKSVQSARRHPRMRIDRFVRSLRFCGQVATPLRLLAKRRVRFARPRSASIPRVARGEERDSTGLPSKIGFRIHRRRADGFPGRSPSAAFERAPRRARARLTVRMFAPRVATLSAGLHPSASCGTNPTRCASRATFASSREAPPGSAARVRSHVRCFPPSRAVSFPAAVQGRVKLGGEAPTPRRRHESRPPRTAGPQQPRPEGRSRRQRVTRAAVPCPRRPSPARNVNPGPAPAPPPPRSPRVDPRAALSIALVAAGTLVYEVLLTRVSALRRPSTSASSSSRTRCSRWVAARCSPRPPSHRRSRAGVGFARPRCSRSHSDLRVPAHLGRPGPAPARGLRVHREPRGLQRRGGPRSSPGAAIGLLLGAAPRGAQGLRGGPRGRGHRLLRDALRPLAHRRGRDGHRRRPRRPRRHDPGPLDPRPRTRRTAAALLAAAAFVDARFSVPSKTELQLTPQTRFIAGDERVARAGARSRASTWTASPRRSGALRLPRRPDAAPGAAGLPRRTAPRVPTSTTTPGRLRLSRDSRCRSTPSRAACPSRAASSSSAPAGATTSGRRRRTARSG